MLSLQRLFKQSKQKIDVLVGRMSTFPSLEFKHMSHTEYGQGNPEGNKFSHVSKDLLPCGLHGNSNSMLRVLES